MVSDIAWATIIKLEIPKKVLHFGKIKNPKKTCYILRKCCTLGCDTLGSCTVHKLYNIFKILQLIKYNWGHHL